MDERTVELLEILARALFWAAGAILVLSVVGAFQVGTSESELPVLGEIQRENRGIAALAAFGGGIASAGILAGLAGILRILLEARDRDLAAREDERRLRAGADD